MKLFPTETPRRTTTARPTRRKPGLLAAVAVHELRTRRLTDRATSVNGRRDAAPSFNSSL